MSSVAEYNPTSEVDNTQTLLLSTQQLVPILEAALFSAGEPLSLDRLLVLFQEDEKPTKAALSEALEILRGHYVDRAVELKKVATGYRFQSKQTFAPWLQRLWERKPPRYSRALLETLALIIYRQPITRGEIEDVRGVTVSSHIIKTLLEREWISVVGHRDVPGKPALFATTKQFLADMNLNSLNELPPLSEIIDLEVVGEQLAEQLKVPMELSMASEKNESIVQDDSVDETIEDETIERDNEHA
ncbi:MAG: SMC-Scp complex subunit ScpB [Gammaproteobacteria bacterium RIFCSPHIGHO2_12_FULL_41_15]|nr:MAG: SMC-Scp complex subunit ScpB [Gammaproteobacteria bacterium RIFCSPHIGHO2_12_FULL_41_15]